MNDYSSRYKIDTHPRSDFASSGKPKEALSERGEHGGGDTAPDIPHEEASGSRPSTSLTCPAKEEARGPEGGDTSPRTIVVQADLPSVEPGAGAAAAENDAHDGAPSTSGGSDSSADAAPRDPGVNDPEVMRIFAKIEAARARIISQDFESLLARKEAGDFIKELKNSIPHGQFGKVFKQLYPKCPNWRADHIKISDQFPDFISAKKYFEKHGGLHVENYYSKCGFFRLIKKHKEALNGGASVDAKRTPSKGSSTKKEVEVLQAEIAQLAADKEAAIKDRDVYRGQVFDLEGTIDASRAQVINLEDRVRRVKLSATIKIGRLLAELKAARRLIAAMRAATNGRLSL